MTLSIIMVYTKVLSRQILTEITREGGYPPLLINPIDFTPLYYQELRARESRADVPLAAARNG